VIVSGLAATAAAADDARELAPDTPRVRPLGRLPPMSEQQASALLAAGDLRDNSLMLVSRDTKI
jgi:hypothetical protein